MAPRRLVSLLFILCLSVAANAATAAASDPLVAAKQLIRAKLFDDAVQLLEILHNDLQGTGESHYLLGSLYWVQGHGGQEVGKSLIEFETAVNLKHAKAMHRLGVLYLVGVEVPQDIARARDLLSEANQLGYRLADAQLLQAQSDFFEMEEWDACALIAYRRDGMLLPTEDWSDAVKKRAFFCAIAASNLRALEIWENEEWGLQWRNRWGQTGLHVAVGAKTYSALEWLLQQGVDVDVADDHGNTPLHLAMALEDRMSIDLLLQHKANWSTPNDAGQVPLEMAMDNGIRHYALSRGARSIKKLARQREKPMILMSLEAPDSGVFAGWPPINVAAWLGNEDVVKALVSTSNLMATDPEGYTPLMRAACAGHHSIYQRLRAAQGEQRLELQHRVQLLRCFSDHKWQGEFHQAASQLDTNLIDSDEFNGLLSLAAEAGFNEELSQLVEGERGTRRVDVATLKHIVQLNNTKLTRQLFALATPTIQQRVLFDALKYGWGMPSDLLQLSVKNKWVDAELDTPLIASSSAGNVEAIAALIPVSEIDAQNKAGNTALHSAVLGNHPAAVQALLQASCDAEIRNEESLTPLMVAVENAGREVVDLLLDAGANLNRRDKFGVSVIDRAEASGRSDLKHLLGH